MTQTLLLLQLRLHHNVTKDTPTESRFKLHVQLRRNCDRLRLVSNKMTLGDF